MPSPKSAVSISRSCSVRSWSTMAANRSTRSARRVARIDRTASGADVGDLGGQAVGADPRVVVEAVHQPDGQRLPTVDAPTGGQQLEGPLPADHRRQGEGDPESLVEAEPGEVGREAAGRCGHPEVGGQGQTQAAADGRPLHGGHQGQGTVDQAVGRPVQGGQCRRSRACRPRRSRARRRSASPRHRAPPPGRRPLPPRPRRRPPRPGGRCRSSWPVVGAARPRPRVRRRVSR